MATFRQRAAELRDVTPIVQLIRELAEFERLTHLLQVTPEKLRPQLFGERPAAEAMVAEADGEVVGFALNHLNAPEGASGSFTTGGTESCLLAVKTARSVPHKPRSAIIRFSFARSSGERELLAVGSEASISSIHSTKQGA